MHTYILIHAYAHKSIHNINENHSNGERKIEPRRERERARKMGGGTRGGWDQTEGERERGRELSKEHMSYRERGSEQERENNGKSRERERAR